MNGEVQDGSIFIIASYAITAVVILGMTLAILYDNARQKRRLAELEARGIRRRSEQPRDQAT